MFLTFECRHKKTAISLIDYCTTVQLFDSNEKNWCEEHTMLFVK